MSILSRDKIEKRMRDEDYSNKLIVTPLLSESQIGVASIDIRLGSSIIIPKKTYVDNQDVTDEKQIRQLEHRLYDYAKLRYHTKFMLHPRQLILGVTFEYLSLPSDIYGMVMSRSSWGRLGLVVATAAAIQPGYKGCLTLELANLSESPIALYPGLSIGQLVFYEVNLDIKVSSVTYPTYSGRYKCPTEAEPPKFFSSDFDQELKFWGEKVKPENLTQISQ